MGTITDYKVVDDHNLDMMSDEVQNLISGGWQPLGGLQVTVPVLEGVPAPLFCQAMVKYQPMK